MVLVAVPVLMIAGCTSGGSTGTTAAANADGPWTRNERLVDAVRAGSDEEALRALHRRHVGLFDLGAGATATSMVSMVEQSREPTMFDEHGMAGASDDVPEPVAGSDARLEDAALDAYRAGLVALGGGNLEEAGWWFDRLYGILNSDRLTDDGRQLLMGLFGSERELRFWKGEPFEQAIAFALMGYRFGAIGEWGNARACAAQSVIRLRDNEQLMRDNGVAGGVDAGTRMYLLAQATSGNQDAVDQLDGPSSPRDRRAAARQLAGIFRELGEQSIESTFVPSDFALGHLIEGLACLEQSRQEGFEGLSEQLVADADACFARASEIDPALDAIIDALRSGRADTLLLVAEGMGPEKIFAVDKEGKETKAITTFTKVGNAAQGESRHRLTVTMPGDGTIVASGLAANVHHLAADLKWRSLDDARATRLAAVRSAAKIMRSEGKGGLFDVFSEDVGELFGQKSIPVEFRQMMTGLSSEISWLGEDGSIDLTDLFVSALEEAWQADRRHVEVMPARFHLIALDSGEAGASGPVDIRVDGTLRLRLPFLPAADRQFAARQGIALHFLRLPEPGVDGRLPEWATAGLALHAVDDLDWNGTTWTGDRFRDESRPDESDQCWDFPYILGGRCVRTPSEVLLNHFHARGWLAEVDSVPELEAMYREAGAVLQPSSAAIGTSDVVHVLDGGRGLFTIDPVSTGAVRRLGSVQPPFAFLNEDLVRGLVQDGHLPEKALLAFPSPAE